MSYCPTIRTKLITKSTFNMLTGQRSEGTQHWITEPCNTPLFGKEEQAGICRSCAAGWSAPGNRLPTDEEMKDYLKSIMPGGHRSPLPEGKKPAHYPDNKK